MKISTKHDFRDVDWRKYKEDIEFELGDKEGTQNLYIKFKDDLGNESETYETEVELDTKAPTIDLEKIDNIYYDSQYLNYYYTSNTITFSGEASKESKIKLYINNNLYNIEPRLKDENTYWEISDVYIPKGNNSIKIIAKDYANNVSKEIKFNLIIDPSKQSFPNSLK